MSATAGPARAHPRLRARAAGLAFLVALTAPFLPACERIDRNMWDNPAYRPQEEPVRLPPKDPIPTKGRERIPSRAEAANRTNPLAPAESNLRKGKELYGIFCVPCHGVSGAGDGPVGKKYVPAPVSLRPGGAAKRTDGELFAVVSAGTGGMPAFRADLAPVERWQIVVWLRSLK